MWLVNFEDGSSISSKRTFWDKMDKGKRISGLQLSHPHLPKLYICLTDQDKYYFAQEGLAFFQGPRTPTVVAEIIGGHDLQLGIGVEVRLSYTGNVGVKTYALSQYKLSPDILYDGLRSGKPKCEVVANGAKAQT